MPSHAAAMIDTTRKARKGWNFARDMSNTRAMMQNSTINKVIMLIQNGNNGCG
jgi:hypothetical protein